MPKPVVWLLLLLPWVSGCYFANQEHRQKTVRRHVSVGMPVADGILGFGLLDRD